MALVASQQLRQYHWAALQFLPVSATSENGMLIQQNSQQKGHGHAWESSFLTTVFATANSLIPHKASRRAPYTTSHAFYPHARQLKSYSQLMDSNE